ncbi:MAG: flagellar motor protein MotB, partial [Cyanobacteria bacterium P01_H01_bin.130]
MSLPPQSPTQSSRPVPPPPPPPPPPPNAGANNPENSPEEDAFLRLRSLLVGDGVIELESRVARVQDTLTRLEKTIEDPQELLDRLVPIGVALIRREISESREDMCEALTPIIDRVIYQRAQQNQAAMAEAISTVLPSAIQTQMEASPESIARALGPEISVAIKEQVTLKRGAVANALAEEMGVAIRRQIEMDRNAMVDALYPVIGRTINKYLQEVIQDINEKMSNSLSPEGIQRKIRAQVQGVSEAELILRESAKFETRAIFLIHKTSGLVIAELQGEGSEPLESEMLAGMLTAIRSFVEDTIIDDDGGSELKEIEYGTSRILLEVAGSCYLAVLVAGEVPRDYQRKLRAMLGLLVQRYGSQIAAFDGDTESVPEEVAPQLEGLV